MLAQEIRRKVEARKGCTLDETPQGAGLFHALLDPEDTALLHQVLDETMEADRHDGDHRSRPRRRLNALLDVFRHYTGCASRTEGLSGQGGNRAQVVIVASADAVVGTPGASSGRLVGLDHGLLTRQPLMRLMCDADVSTVQLSEDLARIGLSRQTRTVSRAQWRPLCQRDRKCVVKGCQRRPSLCQAHHVIWWRNGGASDLDNDVLLCHADHHAVHDQQAWLSLEGGRLLTPSGFLDALEDPPR